jgi:hypothetical protein
MIPVMPDYPDNESTVFPGNSLAMQLLIISARAHGYDYLRNTLSSLLVGLEPVLMTTFHKGILTLLDWASFH